MGPTERDLDSVLAVADALRSATMVTVLTGSGISAESGIPTFREAQTGLWSNYDPQQLATPGAFRRDPVLVWNWYLWRRRLIGDARPNPGHAALARLQDRAPEFVLVTQNIDGLHQAAGNRNVIELHGNIHRSRCTNGHPAGELPSDADLPPRCERCGANVRPDVVWFGESLPSLAFSRALDAARRCELFFSIGTSALVHPAAALPLEAIARGAQVVEINLEPTPLTPFAHHLLQGQAGTILPALVNFAFPVG